VRFLTPAEHRLLTALPDQEAAVVRTMFDQLDARLVSVEPPPVDPSQDALFLEKETRP